MGAVGTNPYTGQSISGYNITPPADDGSVVSSNKLEWDKHKTKLADPVKTFSEAINTAVTSAFAKGVNTDAGVRNQFSGSVAFEYATATIGTDSVPVTASSLLVGTEAGATSDTIQVLTTATDNYDGADVLIRPRAATEELVFVHATATLATATGANIYLTSGDTLTLSNINHSMRLSREDNTASGWVEVNRSGGVGDSELVQIFNASGTWTKPASGIIAIVDGWGGGGGAGNRIAGGGGAGGGGAGHKREVFPLSALGGTETITIGNGGTGAAASSGVSGGGGFSSTFGSLSTFFAGGAGVGGAAVGGGGGAGSPVTTGLTGSGANGGDAGTFGATGAAAGVGGPGSYFGGGGAGSRANGGLGGVGGGGGAGGNDTATGQDGGNALLGGGGGAGGGTSGGGTGGTSESGGAGGDSAFDAAAGAGVQPGGGGGGSGGSGKAGDGGDGRIIVTVV